MTDLERRHIEDDYRSSDPVRVVVGSACNSLDFYHESIEEPDRHIEFPQIFSARMKAFNTGMWLRVIKLATVVPGEYHPHQLIAQASKIDADERAVAEMYGWRSLSNQMKLFSPHVPTSVIERLPLQENAPTNTGRLIRVGHYVVTFTFTSEDKRLLRGRGIDLELLLNPDEFDIKDEI